MNEQELYLTALEHETKAQYDKAHLVLRKLLEKNSKSADYLAFVGRIYFHQGKLEEAKHYFELALGQDSMHSEAYVSLARIEQGIGLYEPVVLKIPSDDE
jgi:tetratricopeptide (TPR) repeat protein